MKPSIIPGLKYIRSISDPVKKLFERGQRRVAERYARDYVPRCRSLIDGPVLVDAQFDNPNYWLRYSLLRSALGIEDSQQIGLLGPHRTKENSRTLAYFGVRNIFSVAESVTPEKSVNAAARIVGGCKSSGDMLKVVLPENCPAGLLYDYILKRQRKAELAIEDPRLVPMVAEFLQALENAQKLFARFQFAVAFLSHPIGLVGPVMWVALVRGVRVVLIQGEYGVNRFVKLSSTDEIYDTVDRPRPIDFASKSKAQIEGYCKLGDHALQRRLAGGTGDIEAKYAYAMASISKTRDDILKQYGWDPAKPIVSIYASNWFDYPHYCGLTNFRDFKDWIDCTLAEIATNQQANWLLRAHPCDEWYGGVTLSDIVRDSPAPHIALTPKGFSGKAMTEIADGVVTMHGTAGIEYPALGKTSMVADKGWYHDFPFTKWCESRSQYLQRLHDLSWLQANTSIRDSARAFIGVYFGRPRWQNGFVLREDTEQWAIYRTIPPLLKRNKDEIAKEIALIAEWFLTESRCFHSWKMLRDDALDPSN